MGYIGNSPDKTVDVVLDTSPQLGGNLDLNSNDITGTGGIPAGNLTGTVANARLDAQLQDVAGLAVTDGGFIVGDGSNFVLETGATVRTSLGLGTAAVLDTGISNTNVPKFTSGVADNDFLRVDGTAIEGRSASEVLSDIAAMPLAGGAFTGDVTFTGDNYNIVFDKSDDALEFADNAKAKFGAGDDLQIYHDGSNSFVSEQGTGSLSILASDQIKLGNSANDEVYAKFNKDGNVELRHDNAVKLETASTGVDVTGDFNASGHVKSEGADGGLIMRTWTQNSSYASLATNDMSGSEYIIINNGEDTYLGSGANGATRIRGPNNGSTAQITVGASQTDVAGPLFVAGKLGLDSTDYIQWTNNTRLDFYVNGANDMRLESDGDLHVEGDVIAFSTTIASDPRLKENVEPVADALSKVEQLTGYTFDYKHGGSSAGVMSTDVAQVLPSAVSQTTLPLKTGDEETEYDVVAYDQLHALLIEAVKELSARVKELENGASK